YYCARQGYFD
nr:immunoglobulin heavy chain junction region [Mus musculus]